MKTIKPTKIGAYSSCKSELRSSEMGDLWAAYMGNSMSKCVLSYFLKQVEDKDIKGTLEHSLSLCEDFLGKIEKIFRSVNHPIPIAFTKDDVNLDAPRLFDDEFYLHYLRQMIRAGINLYALSVPLSTRTDVSEFFIQCVDETMKLVNILNDLLERKGASPKTPVIPVPEKASFVQNEDYFNGYLGKIRPLHALEIKHLFDMVGANSVNKALLFAFSQVSESEKIKQFFKKGEELIANTLETYTHYLTENHLPALPLLDHMVTTSKFSPFSDKLMLFHTIDLFTLRIRDIGNSIAENGRHDLGLTLFKKLTTVGFYVQDGAKLMLENGWMEKISHAPKWE
ncbi:DUF3231 family protein [Neobacillus cucumis]|uniref:DUF3231 domain-containing protein n=1 Tax=Neobacillus cucumis TaxID=1740721 RepID=A0A2N5HAD8_9BACI|nr:DUF3231 family protein [Neobacillus cucumis]PLS02479.1 hypothetical protein CVD27_20235 [Neobacillus cucumis]